MKRIVALIPVVAMAAGLAAVLALPAAATAPRSGPLVVTKECSHYFGHAGDYCTITSSNLNAIPVGSTVVYTDAPAGGALHSDLVLYTRGNNSAFGHVDLNLGTGTGTVTFSGGTGQFKKFTATVHVSPLGAVNFLWDGTYAYN